MTDRNGGARTASNGPGADLTVSDREVDRIVAKLRDPDAVFTRSEVGYLMSRSGRWGYEARVDEENATYPPPPVRVFGKWYDQATERQKADDETRRLVAAERAA